MFSYEEIKEHIKTECVLMNIDEHKDCIVKPIGVYKKNMIDEDECLCENCQRDTLDSIVNRKITEILEKRVDEIIKEKVQRQKLDATNDLVKTINNIHRDLNNLQGRVKALEEKTEME